MIVGVGVDILSLARIRAIVKRGPTYTQRFARRVLSPTEYTAFNSAETAQEQAGYLAARWCLKEAAYKAAFPRQTLRWHDITLSTQRGKPRLDVCWQPALAHLAVHASLSHDADLVIGYVVIEECIK
ncbi:hypothetical protein GGI15_000764 [Coemansia interrupta]|uniref:4'-phosphopantetheinyl transferase domain-containing protein n=1 Tax=Coemansia interrupta TaxID=1126814 RepID=A0A9W8HSI4_9FUNG|nr:hypothetical protein GGI15_000764 [Coemansia interrupta]